MKGLSAYITENYVNIINTQINEAFNSSLLQSLAKQIKTTGNQSAFAVKLFKDLFGAKTVKRIKGDCVLVNCINWSKITDDDFVLYRGYNDAELKHAKKIIRALYAKKTKAIILLCYPNTKDVAMLINGYNIISTGRDMRTTSNIKNDIKMYEFTPNRGMIRRTEKKNTWQERDLKCDEVLDIIVDYDIYSLEITDDMISEFNHLCKSREQAKKGVIYYDEKSLEELAKKQRKQLKELAADLRGKRLVGNSKQVFEELKQLNEEIIAMYENLFMNHADKLENIYSVGNLMHNLAYAFECYRVFVESNEHDKREKMADRDWRSDYYEGRAKQKLLDCEDYMARIRDDFEKIKESLTKTT